MMPLGHALKRRHRGKRPQRSTRTGQPGVGASPGGDMLCWPPCGHLCNPGWESRNLQGAGRLSLNPEALDRDWPDRQHHRQKEASLLTNPRRTIPAMTASVAEEASGLVASSYGQPTGGQRNPLKSGRSTSSVRSKRKQRLCGGSPWALPGSHLEGGSLLSALNDVCNAGGN